MTRYVPLHHHNTTEPSDRAHSSAFEVNDSNRQIVLRASYTGSPLFRDTPDGYRGNNARAIFEALVLTPFEGGNEMFGDVYRDYGATNPNIAQQAPDFGAIQALIDSRGNGGGFPTTPWSPTTASPTVTTGGALAIADSIPATPTPVLRDGGWGRRRNAGPAALNPRTTATEIHRDVLARRPLGSSRNSG